MHVYLGRVAKTARPQLHMPVPFAIGADRQVVVDAARHVRPVAGQDLAVRGLFEIEDVERVRRARNHVGGFRGALAGDAWLEESGDAAERGDIRARRQKFEKLAPRGGGGVV